MREVATLTPVTWHAENQRYLMAGLARVRAALERHLGPNAPEPEPGVEEVAWSLPEPAALTTICEAFALSPFERDLLLLCAGIELDATFAALCAAQGLPGQPAPTFGLALAALPGAHWSAITPAAPLRRWQLLELFPGPSLVSSPLRIDERVLHHLAGTPYLDERLVPYLSPPPPLSPLSPSHAAVVEQVLSAWTEASGVLPAICLTGCSASARRQVAVAVCAAVGLGLHLVDAPRLPTANEDLDHWLRRWQREGALSPAALLVETGEPSEGHAGDDLLRRVVERSSGPLILSGADVLAANRPVLGLTLPTLNGDEQRAAWHAALGDRAARLNGHLDAVVAQFSLDGAAIGAAARASLSGDEDELPARLWAACRTQTRPGMDGLAQRLEPAATWDDLVLPSSQGDILREMVSQVRRRATVYERWGWERRGERGLGITALFAGASGTGKTLAAEVIANELGLDLYRIDLSQMVSKYIGETEKNLARVFNAAEGGGAVLLFDEADALFGKRSEVKDSHDRYANIEVGYLLQRMETYRGLAILTTNMKSALDPAFLRRLRFVVTFPFPDAAQRSEIWRRVFPAATPRDELPLAKLARLNVAGGNIRNIALHATFLAADAGQPVGMGHLLRAARTEYAKLEKPLTEAETGGWT